MNVPKPGLQKDCFAALAGLDIRVDPSRNEGALRTNSHDVITGLAAQLRSRGQKTTKIAQIIAAFLVGIQQQAQGVVRPQICAVKENP